MSTKSLSALALAAAVTAGALALPGTATAADWADAIGATAKVTGVASTLERGGDWTRALRVENARGERRVAATGPYGFFQQALSHRNGPGEDGLGEDGLGLDQLAAR